MYAPLEDGCSKLTNGRPIFYSSHAKLSDWINDYIFLILAFIIIFTNLLVVISSGLILKKGQTPKTTYLFLGNVAMSDLLTGLGLLFVRIVGYYSYSNQYICAIKIGMIICGELASVYSIGFIGVDRFLYIIYGMQYKSLMYTRRARLFISISWIFGVTIGFLPLMGWRGDTNNGKCCLFIVLLPKWLILLIVLATAVPLTVVFFLYSIILYQALKKTKENQQIVHGNNGVVEDISSGKIRMFMGSSQIDLQTAEQQSKQCENKGVFQVLKLKQSISGKWKAIKVVMFTTGGFVITLTPFLIACCIYAFTCDISNENDVCKSLKFLITDILTLLIMLYPILNPIIYAWWHNGFRRFVKEKVNFITRKTCKR